MKMSLVGWIAFILVIIGALNWGLVGLFGLDLVVAILGSIPALVRIVYVLVGISAVYLIIASALKKA